MEFIYQAKNQQGEMIEGKIEAPSEDQAVNVLHQRNLVVLSLDLAQRGFFERDLSGLFSKPNRKDVVLFTRQLATIIEADIPLVEGLHTLEKQSEKPSFKKVISNVANSIEGGATLSKALAEHEKVFGTFYVSLVRAGEIAGKIQTSLSYLADYLERSASLNSKIKGALAYPAFVLFALVAVAIIMMTTVLPQLLTIIEDAGIQDIPFTTKILIQVTDIFNRFIVLILALLAFAVFGFFSYIKTPGGRNWFDNLKIKMPQFGRVTRNIYLARMAETLSTLIKAGVPILESLSITADIVGNSVYKAIILEARDNVQGGGSISEVLEKYEAFPVLVPSMLSIGERTGRTDFMLENIFKFYKSEAENDIQNLAQLIEPVLILILGLGVGALVSAVLLPIYSLVGAG